MNNKATKSTILNIIYRLKNTPPAFHIDIDIEQILCGNKFFFVNVWFYGVICSLYYKFYRNRLPPYFDNFLPEYGDYTHNLHSNLIHLPAIRCEFGAMNAKYQMQSRLRELANPSNPPLYPPMLINVKTLNMSAQRFSNSLKTEVIKSYIDVCIMNDCYVCDNSN